MNETYQLFLVEDNRAYFVNQDPKFFRFEGDTKEDVPYFGQTEMPKPWSTHLRAKLLKVYFEAPFLHAVARNVIDTNKGMNPWLLPTDWTKARKPIMAGVTLEDFITLIRESGGEVYTAAAA